MSCASATPRADSSQGSNSTPRTWKHVELPNNIISTWDDPDNTPPWITRRNENADQPIFRLPPELLARIMELLPTEDLYFARQASITFQDVFSWEAFSNCHAAWEDICFTHVERAAQPPFAPFEHYTWMRLPLGFREPYVTASLLNLDGRKSLGLVPLRQLSSQPLVAWRFPEILAVREKKLAREQLFRPSVCLACARLEACQQWRPAIGCKGCSARSVMAALCDPCEGYVRLCPHVKFTRKELDAVEYPRTGHPLHGVVFRTCERCFHGEEGAQAPVVRAVSREPKCAEMTWTMPITTIAEGAVFTRRLIQDAFDSKLEYTALLCPHYTLAEGPFSLLAEFYERSSQGAVSCPKCDFTYEFQRVDRTVYLHGRVYMHVAISLDIMRHMLETGTYITDEGERHSLCCSGTFIEWIDSIMGDESLMAKGLSLYLPGALLIHLVNRFREDLT